MVVLIHKNAGHLLHTPSVRQRFRPKRIDLEQWRTIVVDRLSRPLLCGPGEHNRNNQKTTDRTEQPCNCSLPHSVYIWCFHGYFS